MSGEDRCEKMLNYASVAAEIYTHAHVSVAEQKVAFCTIREFKPFGNSGLDIPVGKEL